MCWTSGEALTSQEIRVGSKQEAGGSISDDLLTSSLLTPMNISHYQSTAGMANAWPLAQNYDK